MRPRSDLARLLLAMAVVVGVAAVVVGVGFAWTGIASIEFVEDGGGPPAPVEGWSVYQGLLDAGAAASGKVGAASRHRCVEGRTVRTWNCVLPGRGGRDVRYRVVVRKGTSCWRATRPGGRALRGCISGAADYD